MNLLADTLDRAFHLSFWLRRLNPLWSPGPEVRVRVREIIQETHDTKTFVVGPNRFAGKFRAGQFVTVGVSVNGAQRHRCYSIVTAPGSAEFAFTVRRVEGGLVSSWLHDHVKVGTILTLSEPTGSFMVPEPLPAKLLLLSGGSGVTPLMGILRDLADREAIGHQGVEFPIGQTTDVVWLHAAKTPEDIPFKAELDYLQGSRSGLITLYRVDSEEGRLTPESLTEMVPDIRERLTLMCGPTGMMDALSPLWANIPEKLLVERFTQTIAAEPAGGDVLVTLRGGRTVKAPRGIPLLTSLEANGIQHPSGCRMGICNTCVCTKESGYTQNLVTAAHSTEPETIRLCVSAPLSDLTLGIQ